MENSSKKDSIEQDNHQHNYRNHCHRRKRVVITLIGVIIIAIISFWFGVAAGRCSHMLMPGGWYGRFDQNYRLSNINNLSPYSNTANNSVVISGVVTNIKSNQITIIGNGTTDNINLNPNVIYQNGTKLVVNDSVTIYGQYLNNQLVANTIQINP